MLRYTTYGIIFFLYTFHFYGNSHGISIPSFDKAKDILFSNWTQSLQNLKDRVKQMYKQRTLTPRENIGIGPKPSALMDFPGNNISKIEIINNTWSDYYSCLEMQQKVIGEDKTMPLRASVVRQNENIRLECNICVSPRDRGETITWYFSKAVYTEKLLPIEEDQNIQISPYEYALNIFNTQPKHKGYYICKLALANDVPYFLDVLLENNTVIQVKSEQAAEGPYPRKVLKIFKTNIIAWTQQTTWSDCSWCGPVGRRKRMGYCKMALLQNLPDDIVSKAEVVEIDISESIIKITNELLDLFDSGIPCTSSLVPQKLRDQQILQNYSMELRLGYCKEECPGEVIVQIIDKNGDVMDTFNNSAGEFSTLQQVPGIPPTPQRVIQEAYTNMTLKVPCPGNLYTDSPTEWSVKGVVLKSETIQKLSDNRIEIDSTDQLVFKRVQIVDSKVYSCWQRKELAGVAILQVTDEHILDPKFILGIIKLYAVIPIIIIFVYITVRMYMDRKKAKIASSILNNA